MQQNNQLNNSELYNDTLCLDEINTYTKKYTSVVIEFIEFLNSQKFKMNVNYQSYVLVKGLQSLQHIFSFILLYTCNIDLAVYNIQKAFYYYTEFVEQIQKEEQYYVKFNLKDAILFIYKKTIYEINSNYIKNVKITQETVITLKHINHIIEDINEFMFHITKTITSDFDKSINIKEITKDIQFIIDANISKLSNTTHTDTLEDVYRKACKESNKTKDIIQFCKSYYNK
jgi:hypothetical protein